jgi:hypothetical protein
MPPTDGLQGKGRPLPFEMRVVEKLLGKAGYPRIHFMDSRYIQEDAHWRIQGYEEAQVNPMIIEGEDLEEHYDLTNFVLFIKWVAPGFNVSCKRTADGWAKKSIGTISFGSESGRWQSERAIQAKPESAPAKRACLQHARDDHGAL